MLNQSEMETEIVEENDDHWESHSTQLMLDLYLQNVERFRSPKIKKKIVWTDIASAVGKTPDCCDKKFRNLKQTYIRLLKKRSRNEISVVKWPFFEVFEQIYSINGEYQPEISQKIQEGTTDSVAKTLLAMAEPTALDAKLENGESSVGPTIERRKVSKKKLTDFKKATLEMRNRQRVIEDKLDRLIHIVEESNNIQKERNRLFQQFLDGLNPNAT